MRTPLGCLVLIITVFVSTTIFSALRTVSYNLAGIQPNMAPEMFIIFAPIVAAPVALAAALIHVVFRKFFAYKKMIEWAGAGFWYGSLFVGLISPILLLIPALLNPFVFAMLRRKKAQKLTGLN